MFKTDHKMHISTHFKLYFNYCLADLLLTMSIKLRMNDTIKNRSSFFISKHQENHVTAICLTRDFVFLYLFADVEDNEVVKRIVKKKLQQWKVVLVID